MQLRNRLQGAQNVPTKTSLPMQWHFSEKDPLSTATECSIILAYIKNISDANYWANGEDEYVITQRYMQMADLFTFITCTPYIGLCSIRYLLFVLFLGRNIALHYGSQV